VSHRAGKVDRVSMGEVAGHLSEAERAALRARARRFGSRWILALPVIALAGAGAGWLVGRDGSWAALGLLLASLGGLALMALVQIRCQRRWLAECRWAREHGPGGAAPTADEDR